MASLTRPITLPLTPTHPTPRPTPHQILIALKCWKATLYGCLSILFITPMVSFGLIHIPFATRELAYGLAIFFLGPTTISSGVILTDQAKGNIALGLMLTVSTNLLAILTLPLLLPLVFDTRPLAPLASLASLLPASAAAVSAALGANGTNGTSGTNGTDGTVVDGGGLSHVRITALRPHSSRAATQVDVRLPFPPDTPKDL